MNILPKKSWHVRTKKNIERVRRDEAEAERKLKLQQDRILYVEQEALAKELRARAGIADPQVQFNLFEPSLVNSLATNREHEDDKRREKDKWEQKTGILKKLVRSEDVNQPWYCQPREIMNPSSSKSTESANKPGSSLIMSMYDPMTTMNHAEQIARANKAERRKQESIAHQAREKFLMYHRQYTDQSQNNVEYTVDLKDNQSDSSPECIKVIKKSRQIIIGSQPETCHRDARHKKQKKSSHKSSKHHRHNRKKKKHKKHKK